MKSISSNSIPIMSEFKDVYPEHISVSDICSHFYLFLKIEDSISPNNTFLRAVLYFKRFTNRIQISISHRSSPCVFCVAAYIALKMQCDKEYSDLTRFFSKSFKVQIEKLILLESIFLRYISWELYISDKEFQNTLKHIQFPKGSK